MARSSEAFLAEQFPRSQIVPLSATNNDVYLVTSEDGSVVVKLVTDGDIPLDYLAEVNAQGVHRALRPPLPLRKEP